MRLTLPPALVAYYRRLTTRERTLLLITGGAVLLIVNLLLLSVLVRSSRELGAEYAEKSQQLRGEQIAANEKSVLWVPRDAWLKKTQPTSPNLNFEGSKLLETIQGVARGNQVILTNPQIQPLDNGRPGVDGAAGPRDYRAVRVKIDTQSDWQGLVRFLAAVQQPEAFLVFDSANLRTEQNDPKRMRGEFMVAKWYAPADR